MVGREVGDIFPKPDHARGKVVMELRGVSVGDPNLPQKKLVDNVSFSFERRVLGIAGLMGAGRSELLMGFLARTQAAFQATF